MTTVGVTLAMVVVVAVLTSVVAIGPIRLRLFGRWPALYAAIPLLAAGSVWGANQVSEVLKDRLGDSSTPEDNVSVFVEDIRFGFPTIPDDYKTSQVLGAHQKALEDQFSDEEESITLSDAEASRLSDIANRSGQVSDVAAWRPYTLKEIYELCLAGIAFYYPYARWKPVVRKWSVQLALPNADPKTLRERFDSFVANDMRSMLDAAGLFQFVVGVAARRELSLDNDDPKKCLRDAIPYISGNNDNGRYFVHFDTWSMTLTRDPMRIGEAKKLVQLLRFGCAHKLSQAFHYADKSLEVELDAIPKYVDAWNEILAARRSKKLKVRVTFSNTGKYDSFVRREAKMVVGNRGKGSPKIEAVLTAKRNKDDAASGEGSDFLSVRSRSTLTREFQVDLSSDKSESLHGTFVGGLNYLRLGVLVSSGHYQTLVGSQVAPFSADAKKEERAAFDSAKIDLETTPWFLRR